MMMANKMADAIKNSGINGCKDAASALQKFWKAVCDYVSNNLDAKYAWVGVNPTSGAPDPVVILNCKCQAMGTLVPCNLNNADSALAAMSAQMNASAATWMITPDTSKSPGFAVSPGLIIPTINLSASHIDDPDSALEFMCNQIIMGIKAATPALAGTHAAFTGTATFTAIL